MLVRPEQFTDHSAIHALTVAAFGTPAEANLIDRLRRDADPCMSLVAEVDHQIAGHILFTPVIVRTHPSLRMMGLAPMAVASPLQRRGIGSVLVRDGLEACAQLGYGAVVVLGHPTYYPRFGFQRAINFGLTCEYDVPPEAFMVVELQAEFLRGVTGVVSYHPAFADVAPE